MVGMNILITGAKGFVGRNLTATLHSVRDDKGKRFSLSSGLTVFEYDIDTDPALLDLYCKNADFVFHLAGVNRPKDQTEYMAGNFGFSSVLLKTLQKYSNICPVMLSSSIQAVLDNPYGQSKKAGEDLFFQYAAETGARTLIYRFPNVFGKWCRPNYNSAVATFCHNTAHGLPLTVHDPDALMTLVYIDDVMEELLHALSGRETREGVYCTVPVTHTRKLCEIAGLIESFNRCRQARTVPNLSDAFTKKLYATYLSYLPEGGFSYPLPMHCDARGCFTELLRTPERGQISINFSKPGVTKGNHWHHTKNEKFIVVSGRGVIRFREVGCTRVTEYPVSGDRLEVVEVPPGYTHSITNSGDTDLVTVMWASECFDSDRPDTYDEEV